MSLIRVGLMVILVTSGVSCDSEEDKAVAGKQVSAELKSTNLALASLSLTSDVTLTNVTGEADSIGLNFTEDNGCGFNVWAADSQTSKSGLEGRTYEQFDLGDPTSWTSLGAGLQGECESANVAQVESYFTYLDLHLTVDGTEKVVRVYLSQQAPFEAGDLLIKEGTTLSWYDTDAAALVASTETRPTNIANVTLSKEVPWYDNNGTEKIIMLELRIDVDTAQTYTVTKSTGHVIVDVDFSSSGITISDASTDGSILNTISLPFLDTTGTNNTLLTAALTISEDRPAETTEE